MPGIYVWKDRVMRSKYSMENYRFGARRMLAFSKPGSYKVTGE
jgi:hypothetical protein